MSNIEKYKQTVDQFHVGMSGYQNLNDYFVFLLRNKISGDFSVLPNAKMSTFDEKEQMLECLMSEWQLKNNYFFNGLDVREEILDFLLIYMSENDDSFVEVGDSIYFKNVTNDGFSCDAKSFLKTINDRHERMLKGLEIPPPHNYTNKYKETDYVDQYNDYVKYMVSSLADMPREISYTKNAAIKNIIIENFKKVFLLITKKIEDESKKGFDCDKVFQDFKSFVLSSPLRMGIFPKEIKMNEVELNYWMQEWIIDGNVRGVAFAIEKNANLEFKRFYEHPELAMVKKDRLSAMEILKMFGEGRPWYNDVKTELEKGLLLNSLSIIQKDEFYKINSL